AESDSERFSRPTRTASSRPESMAVAGGGSSTGSTTSSGTSQESRARTRRCRRPSVARPDPHAAADLARDPLRRALRGSSLQELTFPYVLRQRCGALELDARLLRPAELPQEVAADGRQQVVRLERRLWDECVHEIEAGSGTERHS